MTRYKLTRASLGVDMNAMCDIAFLLLVFFILTTKPKMDYEQRVHVPAIKSYPICSISESNGLLVIVGKGKFSLDIEGNELRKATLLGIGKKYGITFTSKEVQKFISIPSFGVPVGQLKSFLDNYSPVDQQAGIPAGNRPESELSSWISAWQQAGKQFGENNYRVIIAGDEKEEFVNIKLLINNLQNHGINKFELQAQAYNYSAYEKRL